ncbi:MAG TPA: hypothetical protein VMO26_08840 [Vicinamibacterales bacterium]|nr:hypothetical protein [Vicinamibacterales bacterium]
MTALGNPALRQLAVRALEVRIGAVASPEALAAAARRAYDDLAQVAAPLIGHVGIDALTGRAVHLARQEHPWLLPAGEAEFADGSFAPVVRSLEQRDPVVAVEAVGAVFALLTGLLGTFIGDALTASLLKKAWPDAFADTSTEET